MLVNCIYAYMSCDKKHKKMAAHKESKTLFRWD